MSSVGLESFSMLLICTMPDSIVLNPCRTAFPGTPYQKQDAGQDERVDIPCDCEQVEHVGLFYVCVCECSDKYTQNF